MTKIKLCGLKRMCDIEWANELLPDYIGFIFAKKSKRYVSPELASVLKSKLDARVKAVGVFVNEPVDEVARLLNNGTIDVAQLHGSEDEDYVSSLRQITDKQIYKAFRIDSVEDVYKANLSSADYILLDSGNGGTGTVFDWNLLQGIDRPYFLAGGLNCENIEQAVCTLKPYGVDVSSGIETDGLKDKEKMCRFVKSIRKDK